MRHAVASQSKSLQEWQRVLHAKWQEAQGTLEHRYMGKWGVVRAPREMGFHARATVARPNGKWKAECGAHLSWNTLPSQLSCAQLSDPGPGPP